MPTKFSGSRVSAAAQSATPINTHEQRICQRMAMHPACTDRPSHLKPILLARKSVPFDAQKLGLGLVPSLAPRIC